MTHAPRYQHTFAHAGDGTALACQRQGDGPPLVLLVGQANNHHWWDAVRGDFHAAHSTITLDYRGTGASDKPQGQYSTRQFADDVIAVLDELGIERADVYGTSMGGRVAQGAPPLGEGRRTGCGGSSSGALPWAARTPSNGTPRYGEIPDARAHVFPGSRHAYFEECRASASAIVSAFLDGGVRPGVQSEV